MPFSSTKALMPGLSRIGCDVSSSHGGVLDNRLRNLRLRVHRVAATRIVVFDASLPLLLLTERDVEVEVEVAPKRGGPGERPSHPEFVRLHFRERGERHS